MDAHIATPLNFSASREFTGFARHKEPRMDKEALIEITSEIVSAHVSNNEVKVGEMGGLVQQVHAALSMLGQGAEAPVEKLPVVSVRASIRPDHLVCMECGARQKMLKRHLQAAHQMTPDQYRQDYGLPSTYPMVAAEYAERRRDLAKQIGLGRKKGEKPGARRRKPKAAAAKQR
jgi:predicted transcriptional regulator